MEKHICRTAAVSLAVFVCLCEMLHVFAQPKEELEEKEPVLTGQVLHTERWEANRLEANKFYREKNLPEKLRSSEVFWSGEKFILQAKISGEELPPSVLVFIEETDYRGKLFRRGDIYRGELFDKEMLFLWGRKEPKQLTFVFQAVVCGKALQERQRVTIDDREPYWILHRKKIEKPIVSSPE